MVRRTLLLLGPSQVGKSALANLLATGSCDYESNKFELGDGIESCTVSPQCEDFTYSYQCLDNLGEYGLEDVIPTEDSSRIITRTIDFSVIDSAGAGDGSDNDSNILKLYEYLLKPDIEISCVLLVIKFPTLQDGKYKTIIQFYKQMLASIFQKNVVVVITHAPIKDPRWIKMMKKTGKNPAKAIEKVIQSLQDLLGLDYPIRHFALNVLADSDDMEDFLHTRDCRRKILEMCVDVPGFRPSRLNYPKPPVWKAKDNVKQEHLEQELMNLLQTIQDYVTAEAYQDRTARLDKVIDDHKKLLTGLDTDDLVVVNSMNVTGNQTAFWWTQRPFYIEAKCPIKEAIVSGANVLSKDIMENRVTGVVQSNWFSKLDATVMVMSTSRVRHAEDIAKWKSKCEKVELELNLERELFMSKAGRYDGEKQKKLQRQVKDINKQLAALRSETLTYEAVLQRIRAMA
jgi:hypothetical protein